MFAMKDKIQGNGFEAGVTTMKVYIKIWFTKGGWGIL